MNKYPLLYIIIIFLSAFHCNSHALAEESNKLSATNITSAQDTTPMLQGTVLRVNDDAITSAQIIALVGETIQKLPANLTLQQFAEKTTSQIVQATTGRVYQLLLYQKACYELKNLETLEPVLDAALAEQRKKIIADFGGTEARARAELAKQDITIEEQLGDIRRDFVVQAYREMSFTPTLRITRKHMLSHYRKHRQEKYFQNPKIEFRLIDIHIDEFLPDNTTNKPTEKQLEHTRLAAQSAASQAWEKLQNGDDFIEIAKQYSHGFRKDDGGLWPARDPDSFRKQYQPVIKALKEIIPGQYTQITPADNRFFIAMLIGYERGGYVPFTDAQEEIKKTLRQERWQEFSTQLSISLMEKASMGSIDKFIYETTTVAYQQLYKKP